MKTKGLDSGFSPTLQARQRRVSAASREPYQQNCQKQYREPPEPELDPEPEEPEPEPEPLELPEEPEPELLELPEEPDPEPLDEPDPAEALTATAQVDVLVEVVTELP